GRHPSPLTVDWPTARLGDLRRTGSIQRAGRAGTQTRGVACRFGQISRDSRSSREFSGPPGAVPVRPAADKYWSNACAAEVSCGDHAPGESTDGGIHHHRAEPGAAGDLYVLRERRRNRVIFTISGEAQGTGRTVDGCRKDRGGGRREVKGENGGPGCCRESSR